MAPELSLGRQSAPRSFVVLDESFRVCFSNGLPAEIAPPRAQALDRLPLPLELQVRQIVGAWQKRGESARATASLVAEHTAMLVFPLVGANAYRIGVLFESYRTRAEDK